MDKTTDYKTLKAELDDVLDKLQSSDIDVDEAVKLYERGMELTSLLQDQLTAAQNKVTKLRAKFDRQA